MDWWNVLKARGAAKRRKEDQRDLEEFAERRDKHFADGKVGPRSMVSIRAPQALAGVQHKNIKFTNPDEVKEVSINPNATFTSRNANISRQIRDQGRAEKERNRNQNLQSHFEGSGITGARKLMGDEGVEVHLPIRQVKRPKHPYGLGSYGGGRSPSRGQYKHPSEAFNAKNIKRLVQEGFTPSPNQLLQLPEGQRTMEDM
jgi:hypothetical protein|tara:strand:- start:211 stop:813 length:603 start_codon:yes stop_codon:yes gene_type:complete